MQEREEERVEETGEGVKHEIDSTSILLIKQFTLVCLLSLVTVQLAGEGPGNEATPPLCLQLPGL